MIIVDFEDKEVKIGTRVKIWDYNENHPEWGDGTDTRYFGEVIGISNWDGDVDDEGRSIGIPPYVYVRFDNEGVESFITSEWEWETGYAFERTPICGKVEELTVI